MDKYWTNQDILEIQEATSFEELNKVAHRVLDRMPPNAGMVCGPISTGGVGSVDKNMAVFSMYLEKLIAKGHNIFVQLYFEGKMAELKKITGNSNYRLLNDFYLPLFESGKITNFHFIPHWESSFGARWEHTQAHRLGIAIDYLKPKTFFEDEFLVRA